MSATSTSARERPCAPRARTSSSPCRSSGGDVRETQRGVDVGFGRARHGCAAGIAHAPRPRSSPRAAACRRSCRTCAAEPVCQSATNGASCRRTRAEARSPRPLTWTTARCGPRWRTSSGLQAVQGAGQRVCRVRRARAGRRCRRRSARSAGRCRAAGARRIGPAWSSSCSMTQSRTRDGAPERQPRRVPTRRREPLREIGISGASPSVGSSSRDSSKAASTAMSAAVTTPVPPVRADDVRGIDVRQAQQGGEVGGQAGESRRRRRRRRRARRRPAGPGRPRAATRRASAHGAPAFSSVAPMVTSGGRSDRAPLLRGGKSTSARARSPRTSATAASVASARGNASRSARAAEEKNRFSRSTAPGAGGLVRRASLVSVGRLAAAHSGSPPFSTAAVRPRSSSVATTRAATTSSGIGVVDDDVAVLGERERRPRRRARRGPPPAAAACCARTGTSDRASTITGACRRRDVP